MDPYTQNKKVIFELLRAKNKSAVSILYDAFASMLYGIAFRLTGNQTTAEELVKETLLTFFNEFSSFDENKESMPMHLICILRTLSGKLPVDSNRSLKSYISSSKNILEYILLSGNVKQATQDLSINEAEVRRLLRRSLSDSEKKSEQVS